MKKYFNFTIYDKYIFTQLLITTCVAILLFTVVWIAPEILLNNIKYVIAGVYTPFQAFMAICYELPSILGKALPVGLLLGTLFTFDKLSKDSELTIFRAIGLSFKRIIMPVLALSFIGTALCFITLDRLIPIAEKQKNAMETFKEPIQYIYTQKDENEIPIKSIVVSKYDHVKMEKIVVLDFSRQIFQDLHALSNIYIAKVGYVRDNYWELQDIKAYQISQEGIYTNVSKLKSMKILEGEDSQNAFKLMSYSIKDQEDFTNKNLNSYIKLLKQENLDEEYRYMKNKYLQRFFHPFVCVLLAVMGALLGFSKPREQRLVGFTIAIGCIFLYYITLPFFDLLAEKGVLPPLITASFPPIAFLCAIIAFYRTKDL